MAGDLQRHKFTHTHLVCLRPSCSPLDSPPVTLATLALLVRFVCVYVCACVYLSGWLVV